MLPANVHITYSDYPSFMPKGFHKILLEFLGFYTSHPNHYSKFSVKKTAKKNNQSHSTIKTLFWLLRKPEETFLKKLLLKKLPD
jgi:hypothetical protein